MNQTGYSSLSIGISDYYSAYYLVNIRLFIGGVQYEFGSLMTFS